MLPQNKAGSRANNKSIVGEPSFKMYLLLFWLESLGLFAGTTKRAAG
ncbi:hypothetical protein BSBH6_03898 [Bacillus subtilis]|nr:hypothetical protein BSBH6_03898 [Bacillus subtilis]RPK20508.1 hypothetical protein BH5_03718 [Bacillus subtilis]